MISKPIATMKNLFKNLMLVAVAAMAFTACTETNDEVNAVVNKTRYEFTANIAEDTRSGFAEKEEGATAYKSEWHEGDQVKIFVEGYEAIVADVTTEGKFAFELENAPESFFVTVVSPAEAWVSEYTANLPEVQTPLANSVDPKAHLLQAQAVPVSGNNGDINFTHMAAYGKMTVNGVAFAIDHVVVDLKGSFFGYDREYSYTINAANVVDNTFWFATEPIDVAEFTVTAYDAEGNSVAKTVDVAEAGKTMSFNYGRVGTFSVKDLEAVVAPEEPKALVFTSATWTNTWAPSDKLIQFYSDEIGTLQLNFYGCNEENYLDARTYGFAKYGDIYPGSSYSWLIDTNNTSHYVAMGSVNVSVVGGKYYIEFNNLTNSDATFTLTATYEGDIDYLAVPDSRTKLDAPAPTATAEGKMVTISWNDVTGADAYYVFCATTSAVDPVTTTETSVTIEVPDYATYYQFMVTALAYDTNPNYKSSNAVYVSLTSGKDPNFIAQYMWDESFVWNNSGYFELRDSSYGTSSYWYIYLNAADRPGNNSIKPGVYTGVSNTGPGVGQFSIKIGASGSAPFWSIYTSYVSSSDTLEVKVVDGKYVIVYTYGDQTYGYVGLPDGFVLPSEDDGSGDEGDSGEDVGDGSIQMTKLYYRESAANLHNFVLENADKSTQIVISMNNQDVLTTWIPMYTYTSQSLNIANGNPGYFTLQYDKAKINGASYELNATGHTLKVISSSNGGNHELELTVATTSGEYKFKFSGSLGM